MLNQKKLSFFLFLFSSAWIQGVDGDLDPTFGVGGLVITDFGGKDANSRVGVHIQTDGKIVVFSNTTAGANPPNFALARYLPNGSLDNTFGNNGLVITDFGGNEFSGDIAIQADGRIVIAGGNKLVRYNTNGSLDTSFGTNGEVNTSVDAFDVVIQPDQLILTSGNLSGNFVLARYLPNGNLDNTFGTNGIVVTDFGGDESNPAVAIQQDGKILVGGFTDQGPNPGNFALARYNKNGTLDTTFGSSGLVITDFNGGYDIANDIAVQADGKILVSGTTLSGSTANDFAIARYNTDGSLDNTFGTNGLTIIDFGGSETPFRPSVGIQGDGKILVSGDTTVGANPKNFAITRLLTTGLVDTSFGINGLVITDFNGRNDTSNTVAIQEDGKFVVVGYTNGDFGVARYLSTPTLAPITINQVGTNSGNLILSGTAQNLSSITILADGIPVCSTFTQGTGLIGTWTCSISLPNGTFDIKAVSTYYAGRINLETDTIKVTLNGVDGDLDPTFGVGGLVITDFGGFDAGSRVGVHIQADGKIVVFSNTTAGANPPNFALARYLPNGSLDNTFGNNGLVITDVGGSESSGDIAIQADGRIVVAGSNKLVRYNTNGSLDTSFGINGEVNTSVNLSDVLIQPDQLILTSGDLSGNFVLARYLPNGNLDNTFGTNGIVVTDFGGNESNTAVAIQQDGKILVGGSTDQGPNPGNFALARYNKNGTLDTTFGSSGLVITDFNGGYDIANNIAVQADGKILVSGTTLSGVIGDLAVARYNTDGSLDNTFGTNGLTVIDFGGSEDPVRASVGIQGDGKILVSGDTTVGANPNNFAITRLLTTGLVDTSFGVNGLVITDFNGRFDSSEAVAIQEDGKFVVVGFTSIGNNGDLGVARYLSTPTLAPITINQAGTNNGNLILSGTAQNLSSITILADGIPVCSTFTQGTGLIGTWTCSISLPNGTFDIKAVSTYYAGRINLETDTIKVTLNRSDTEVICNKIDTEVTLNRSALSQAIRNKYCPNTIKIICK